MSISICFANLFELGLLHVSSLCRLFLFFPFPIFLLFSSYFPFSFFCTASFVLLFLHTNYYTCSKCASTTLNKLKP